MKAVPRSRFLRAARDPGRARIASDVVLLDDLAVEIDVEALDLDVALDP